MGVNPGWTDTQELSVCLEADEEVVKVRSGYSAGGPCLGGGSSFGGGANFRALSRLFLNSWGCAREDRTVWRSSEWSGVARGEFGVVAQTLAFGLD